MFNFKSSGVKISDSKFTEAAPESKLRPIGIKTPLEEGNDDAELFKMNLDPTVQLGDNLKNLILTNNGERLGRYNIGCNLKSILFDRNSQNSSEYEKIAIENLKEQTRKFLPLVTIDQVSFTPEDKMYEDKTSLAKVIVKIKFSIPKLRSLNNTIEVVLYNGG